jgi:uroporphyrin-III C-methyltransferase/precorrin-2 dehydrogenase/sirohydrochlorin ferrochelatase
MNKILKPKSQNPNPNGAFPVSGFLVLVLDLGFGIWVLNNGFVSLVGAGPGDPDLWTVRARRRVQEADLVLYDALVDTEGLRRITQAPCFCVGKRARRASVKQETIHRLMIRAARSGKRVVRLKGGDPFVFGRGAEEALALAHAGIRFEVVPGVTSAVAAAELAGIPVTHRGVSSAFLVVAGQTGKPLEQSLAAVRPGSVTLVVMMGLAQRAEVAQCLAALGWPADTPAAIVCGASTTQAWTWIGRIGDLAAALPPDGLAGVLVVGEVIRVREALAATGASLAGVDEEEDGVSYGRNR